MKLENLTDEESKNMTIISFVILLIVVLMASVLIFYKFFMNSTKHLNMIINTLAVLYLGLVVGGAILYFVYRHDKADIENQSDMIIKPLIAIIVGITITVSTLYLKNHLMGDMSTISAASTTTIVGNTSTSPMNLTGTP
jgi:uncharacterized membrane protein